MTFDGLKKRADALLKKKAAEMQEYHDWLADGNNPTDLDFARDTNGMIAQMKIQKDFERTAKRLFKDKE